MTRAMLLKSQSQIEVGEKPEIPPDVFKDKIVFVGIAFSGLVDVFQTPFGAGSMIGIQLHASVADSILSNRFLRPARAWTAVAATVGAALVIGLMSATLPFWVAAAIAAALVAGWTGAGLYAFDRGLWLVMAQPILASAVALFAGTAYRYFVEDAEKRKVSRLFGRYVSRDVYKQLMAHPELAELGGGRREMSVLFSDLRGFTSITEKGNPEALVEQLNEYFTRMVEIVFRNGGTVDKFVGDMVMALFGAPVDDVDHADDAVTTAVEMVRELGELNRRWASEGPRPARYRHRGEFGRNDCREHRFLGDHELHGDRRQRQPGRQARVAEQGLQDPHYHQRGHARPAGQELRTAPPWGAWWSRGKRGRSRSSRSLRRRRSSRAMGRATVGRRPGNMRENPYEEKCALVLSLAVTALAIGVRPAAAQLGGITGALKKAQTVKKIADLKVTDAEERQIGQQVSDKMVETFGVYQDANVTKYVTLVGAVMALQSPRPGLDWQFVVLDTEGVNAFAAPGGFIHITKGLLGLMKNEAELAGVLAHEIIHVTEKHTVNAIQQGDAISMTSDSVGAAGGMTQSLIADFAQRAYSQHPQRQVQPRRRERGG